MPLIHETPVDEARLHDEFVFLLEIHDPKHPLEVLRSKANVPMKMQTSNLQCTPDGFCEVTRSDLMRGVKESQVRSRSVTMPHVHKIEPPDRHEALFASHGSYMVWLT